MAAPVGPKKVHRYTLEFKIQAVKLANHPEIQTQDVAHAMDIHPFMVSAAPSSTIVWVRRTAKR